MPQLLNEKTDLSMKGLLRKMESIFNSIPEPTKERGPKATIAATDCLMSALAIFGMKSSSLLQFEHISRNDESIQHNLKTLYYVEKVPSDTYFRQKLDVVNPNDIRKTFTTLFSTLQRNNYLNDFRFLDGFYLLSIDGTGYFSSNSIHCEQCCERVHKKGTPEESKSYYHQMFSGAIVHPDKKTVIPICPEPILKQDGATKNDCERNATVRMLSNFRREHPHLKTIILQDALGANGPNIERIQSSKMSFIISVKPEGNKSLFEWINDCSDEELKEYKLKKEELTHRFRFINRVPLNDSHADLEVNFLEYWQLDKDGKIEQHFTWITDIELTKSNVYQIMRGGRSRWRIENETFNTLKNQGYNFEHNYGHGYKFLSTNLAFLMMLAFGIDQALQIGCRLFQAALEASERKLYLWNKLRSLFENYFIDDWSELYHAIIYGHKKTKIALDTS